MSTKTIRLSVDMDVKDHKKLKILADAMGVTLREFILNLLDPVLHPKKIPNTETIKAMQDARSGKTVKPKDFHDFCKKLGL